MPRFDTKARRASGFTLIELLIAMVIIAILAATAVAAYDWATRKARRGAAQACLTETAQFMERFYTLNFSYAQDTDGNAVEPPGCERGVAAHYDVHFVAGEPTARTFVLEAVPQGGQARDAVCGTMRLDQRGAKAPAGDCWQ